MAKAAKKRTQVKTLSRKKKLSSKDMKKVKGGHNYLVTHNHAGTIGEGSLILPISQKVKK